MSIRKWFINTFGLAIILIASVACLDVCTSNRNKPIHISASNWIGYTPLFYIHEKAWMKNVIEFSPVSSLMESEKMFQAGITDGFVGTQYEYEHSRLVSGSLVPVILIDRSNGADSILSNATFDELVQSRNVITVYMETQSVNYSLFRSFLEEHNLSGDRFKAVNRDQVSIAAMTAVPPPVMLVTYEPYKTELIKNGFMEIANTRDMNLLVLDALFIEEDILNSRRKDIVSLKRNLQLALDALQNDPQEFYETVKPYLDKQTYQDFSKALGNIEWLLKDPTEGFSIILEKNGIPLDWIVR
jgi:NitT/TauT family transport system substrate-binding protein